MNAQTNATALTEYDFIVVVDASGSMETEDVKGRSRWAAVQEAEAFATTAEMVIAAIND